MASGLVAGVVAGLLFGTAFWLVEGHIGALGLGLVAGLVAGLAGGAGVGLLAALREPIEQTQVAKSSGRPAGSTSSGMRCCRSTWPKRARTRSSVRRPTAKATTTSALRFSGLWRRRPVGGEQ